MISKFLISIFKDSAFLFSMLFIVILYHISTAFEACAKAKSASQKCHTSLCTIFIVTLFGISIFATACFNASILEGQSAFKISLNSDSLFHCLSSVMNCCIADSVDSSFVFSWISAIFS